MDVVSILRIGLAIIVAVLALTALTDLGVNPEGLLFFAAFVVAMFLVSFSDRERFWPQPPKR